MGEITDEQKRILASFVPHGRAAVRTQTALRNQSMQSSIDALQLARVTALLCDATGKVTVMTRSAIDLLGQSKILHITGGRLATYCASKTDVLMAKIRAATQTHDRPFNMADNVMYISDGDEWVVIEVNRVPRADLLQTLGGAALVTFRHRLRPSSEITEILQSVLCLSHAETDICLKLACGVPIKKIAMLRQCAPETTRKQVRSIFEKLRIHRQSDLVALIGRLTQ